MDSPTVVDLFCGAGGFSLGFSQAGFAIVQGVDSFPSALTTYTQNLHPERALLSDLRRVDPSKIPPCDVLLGSPPCEAFSIASSGRRKRPIDRLYEDPRGSMTLLFFRFVKEVRPRIFVLENVPQILEGPLLKELQTIVRRVGYPRLHVNELRAEEHGTPSRRRRVFLSNVPLHPPRDPHTPTLREALGDLEEIDPALPNHVELPVRGKRRERIAHLPVGGSLYTYRSTTGRVFGSWTRLRWDEPAPPVMGLSRFVHPSQPRLLTPREHARLMGYPDDFVFFGSRTEVYEMIGESVPPPLSRAVAEEILRALREPSEREPPKEPPAEPPEELRRRRLR